MYFNEIHVVKINLNNFLHCKQTNYIRSESHMYCTELLILLFANSINLKTSFIFIILRKNHIECVVVMISNCSTDPFNLAIVLCHN